MGKTLHRTVAVLCFGAALVAASAYGAVNKGITIDSGTQTGGHSTVNGNIVAGDSAVVDGSLETVNGTIRIADNVQLRDAGTVNGSIRIGSGVIADDVESVNGSIRVGGNARISGEISAVNGKIEVGAGGSVAGDVSNVNGEFRIVGTEIGGDLTTVSGDVWLTENSTLSGDLVVEKPRGWGNKRRRMPKVVIGPGSRVLGRIVAEREIELYLSDTAEVGEVTGEIALEDAVRFSGARP